MANPAPQSAKSTAASLLATAHQELADALGKPHILLAPLPLPTVALRVTNMSEDESDAATLAGLIQKDAGLAAQIVRVANSALYARRTPVVSLQQAISWLGIAEVRKVAISCALRAHLFAGKHAERLLGAVWRESLATACFSQEIARLQRRGVEQAYLAGLLHRSGLAALIQIMAKSAGCAAVLEFDAATAELAAAYEGELATLLARDWGLPDFIAAGMRWWRTPESETARSSSRPARVGLAETVAARAFAASVQDETVLADDALPPTLPEALSWCAAELGLYQDDLQLLWAKRHVVVKTVESLQ